MWKRGQNDPRGQVAGGSRVAACGGRRRRAGCNPSQASAQLAPTPHRHCAPHWHWAPQWQCGPQAPAVCAAACWQPQAQLLPGHVVQLQEACWVVFMVGSFGLHRRRDVFDGCTFGGAAAHGQRDKTNGRPVCGSRLADRPNGCASGACRAPQARRLPSLTVRSRVRTLAGPISKVGRMLLSLPARAADSSPQRTPIVFAPNQENRRGRFVRTGSGTGRPGAAAR